MLGSIDEGRLLALALLLASSACTMKNPAFGETGESSGAEGADSQAEGTGVGEVGSADAGDGDGGVTSGDGDDTGVMVSTGNAEGEVDTGDGDADTGDGDGDAGDGDGEEGPGTTGAPCEVVQIPVAADTFVVNGPQEGSPSTCLLGWGWQGEPGQVCEHLNFGGSEELWIGEEGNGQDGHSLYLGRFNLDALPSIGTFTEVAEAQLKFTLISLEPTPVGTSMWAELLPAGEQGAWVEGELDGQQPAEGAGVTTYKYQYFATQAWPLNSPLSGYTTPIGEVSVGGIMGEYEASLHIPPTLLDAWFANDPAQVLGNGFVLGSNAPLFDLLLASKDNLEGLPPPRLEVTVCY